MLDSKYTKPVNSIVSTHTEVTSVVTLTGSSLEYTLCNRTSLTTNRGNYFVSFNLPAESSDLPTTSAISLLYPELQQLNVDKIIIAQIPSSGFTEFIDGRSITLTVPVIYNNIVTAYTLYSSTYSSDKALKYGETSPLLGDNIAFLFSDQINRPYTGNTYNELGQIISHSAVTTWNPSPNISERTAAISYLEVQGSVAAIGTDLRPSIRYTTNIEAGYPSHIGYSSAYNYDVPAGFVVLDKGVIVLTHSAITETFAWNNSFYRDGSAVGTSEDDKHHAHFNTGNTYGLTFTDINTEFKTSAVCMALNGEFYISNNRTWDRNVATSQFGSNRPVYITEVGLYNAFGELVAVAKFSEPIERYVNDIFTFYVELNM